MSDKKRSNQEEIDLMLENQSLQSDILSKGGSFWKEQDMDPTLENEFLKNVLSCCNNSKDQEVPMRSLFPANYKFPPADSMSKNELKRKLNDIEGILNKHNVQLGFCEELPHKVLYKHLIEDCIPNESIDVSPDNTFITTLSGCSGDCESCFQKKYCSTAKELEQEEF
ncbi:hypothetical protein QA601_09065 [Chitinispirillales bacterium ANBcel5]|uniref:hypothetical protein n=1 Tax=Cellulosispirillum alkaliphilum TaxID=3039283 RepID=UPI002A5977F0|nr:hypothetical protein [Chitinispirillales bacterium ANBcel5]